MPKTLLAVDDSPTMRKVLEITFAGEDFRVVSAENTSSALSRMSEGPVVAVIDASLGSEDGYALAKAVRSRDGRIAIVIVSSRFNPYDPNRGRDAGVDDFIDKPFDTQALIDKVKKAVVARESAKAAVGAPAPAPAPPLAAAAAVAPVAAGPAGAPRAPGGGPPPPPAAKPAWPAQRAHTLSFEGGSPATAQSTRTSPTGTPFVQPPAAAQPPAAPPTAPASAAAHVAPTAAPPSAYAAPSAPQRAPEPAALSAAANGQLAGKLGDLGLSRQQIDAVLALSHDVIERVVWEVVPRMCEVLIREEIARLMKEP